MNPFFLAGVKCIMLYVSWDPILIGISFVVAFIASFVALDSASKIFLPRSRCTFLAILRRGDVGHGNMVNAFCGYAGNAHAYRNAL
jgi:NO-binding membrane sensor protein with MHYT domain